METAKSIREDFLHQNAYHEVDTYSSHRKQYKMLKAILEFHARAMDALAAGGSLAQILDLPVRERIARMKYIPESESDKFDQLYQDMASEIAGVSRAGGEEVA
ncbi:MAG TPA: hypothetical protein GX509_10000 [Firmicutes bacterium]|nr:hypothetical protein [Bacillota bacterium]